MVTDLARREVARIHDITRGANQLEKEITQRVSEMAPSLIELPGCAGLTAAKLSGESADITPFKSRDTYAMFNGPHQSQYGPETTPDSVSTAEVIDRPTPRSTGSLRRSYVSIDQPKNWWADT